MKKSASNFQEKTLSSGVTVQVLPFPAGLWDEINSQFQVDYPDPVPPKKIIQVLGGTEEVDDLENPEYKQKALEIKTARDNAKGKVIGEATLDFCLQIDLAPYENAIKRLEKYTGKFPTDPDERRIQFLTKYALRSRGDYEAVTFSAVSQMAIGDKEVAERVQNNFQNNVARSATNDNGASSLPQDIGLEVVTSL